MATHIKAEGILFYYDIPLLVFARFDDGVPAFVMATHDEEKDRMSRVQDDQRNHCKIR